MPSTLFNPAILSLTMLDRSVCNGVLIIDRSSNDYYSSLLLSLSINHMSDTHGVKGNCRS